jgi:hypothetical protein
MTEDIEQIMLKLNKILSGNKMLPEMYRDRCSYNLDTNKIQIITGVAVEPNELMVHKIDGRIGTLYQTNKVDRYFTENCVVPFDRWFKCLLKEGDATKIEFILWNIELF